MTSARKRRSGPQAATASAPEPWSPAPIGRLTWLLAALLLTLTVAAYAPVRHFDFVQFDDPAYVTENDHVRAGLTADGLVWALTKSESANWHPLTWLSHMADVELFGLNAGAHHLVNLALHLASSVLLLLLLVRLTGALWRSGFVAAVFALHPLHVESVAWIAERKDVLSALFWMLTMWAYVWHVQRPGRGRFAIVTMLFALGLMAKPMVVTLPIVLLLIDLWPLGRWTWARPSTVAPMFIEKIPLLALSVASGVVTILAQKAGGAMSTLDTIPIDTRLVNAVLAVPRYLGKMVWPAGLSIIYPMPDEVAPAAILGAVILGAGLTIVAIRGASRRPALTVGWFWFLVVLAPVSGLLQVGIHAFADRFTYLSMIGISIAVAWAARDRFLQSVANRAVVATIAAGIVVAMTLTTYRQVWVWQDNVTLWTNATMLTLNMDEYSAHLSLGGTLLQEKRLDEARAHFEAASRLDPDSAQARRGIGLAYLAADRPAEAIAPLEAAARLASSDPDTGNDLAVAYVRAGRRDDAIREYRRLLALRPGDERFTKALAALGGLVQ